MKTRLQKEFDWWVNRNTAFPLFAGAYIWIILSGFDPISIKNLGPYIVRPWFVWAIILRAGVMIQSNWVKIRKSRALGFFFSIILSGYLGQFSYWMSLLRVIEDTIRTGYLRSAPYIAEYSPVYGVKWRIHFSIEGTIPTHILMIALMAFNIWSLYGLYKPPREW